MLDEYLRFFFLSPFDFKKPESAEIHGIEISRGPDGVELKSNIDEDAPEKVKNLFHAIDKRLRELEDNGQLEKLNEDDVEQIMGNIFNETLGDPDEVIEETNNGRIYEKKTWFLENGTITKNIIKSLSKDDEFPIGSIEYL